MRILLILLILRRRRRRQASNQRKIWVKPWILRRAHLGAYSNLVQEIATDDLQSYRKFMRMTPESFQAILEMVMPLITKQDTHLRKCISAGERLTITLRYLATGESFTSLSFLFRVGERTISNIVKETSSAIFYSMGQQYLKIPDDASAWKKIALAFERKWNYPMCLGALDGKHVAIKKPANTGSTYFNYKGFFSVVLLALADADYKFLFVDVGAPGRAGDAGIFNASTLKRCMDQDLLGWPSPQALENTNEEVSYHLLGDAAFQLRSDLMKPYPYRNVNVNEKIYNYRLSRARRVIENAFGILAQRFRVFFTTISLGPEVVEDLVLASCCLHNFLIENQSSFYIQVGDIDQENQNHDMVQGSWRQNNNLSGLDSSRINKSSQHSRHQRDVLKDYFNSTDGSVPWQNQMIF